MKDEMKRVNRFWDEAAKRLASADATGHQGHSYRTAGAYEQRITVRWLVWLSNRVFGFESPFFAGKENGRFFY
jgi:hypothetical protein